MRSASARSSGQGRLWGGPWWFNNDLISPSGVLPTWAAEFATIEGGRYMAGGVSKTFAGAIDATRDSDGTFFDAATILQTAITDVARFDHDPVTGARLGLLVEEERENICLQSENLGTKWINVNSTESLDAATALDGATTADEIVEDSDTAQPHYMYQTIAFTSGQTSTFSVFVKKNTRDHIRLVFGNFAFPANVDAEFNLVTGVVSATGANLDSASIEDVGNGWFRCSITGTADATDNTFCLMYLHDGTTVNYDGDGSSGLYYWGMQVEVETFATSYIKTTASPVTRKADIFSLVQDGGLPFPGYNTVEGTFVVEAIPLGHTISAFLTISDGTANNRMQINFGSNGAVTVFVQTGGVTQASINVPGVHAVGSVVKMAFRYKLNDYGISVNGEAVVTDTSATVPPVNIAYIGSLKGTSRFINALFRDVLYYPRAFSDSELVELAT